MDVATEITMLHLMKEDTIHYFYCKVQEIQIELQYSRENVDETRLVRFYQKAIQDFIPEFRKDRGITRSDANRQI